MSGDTGLLQWVPSAASEWIHEQVADFSTFDLDSDGFLNVTEFALAVQNVGVAAMEDFPKGTDGMFVASNSYMVGWVFLLVELCCLYIVSPAILRFLKRKLRGTPQEESTEEKQPNISRTSSVASVSAPEAEPQEGRNSGAQQAAPEHVREQQPSHRASAPGNMGSASYKNSLLEIPKPVRKLRIEISEQKAKEKADKKVAASKRRDVKCVIYITELFAFVAYLILGILYGGWSFLASPAQYSDPTFDEIEQFVALVLLSAAVYIFLYPLELTYDLSMRNSLRLHHITVILVATLLFMMVDTFLSAYAARTAYALLMHAFLEPNVFLALLLYRLVPSTPWQFFYASAILYFFTKVVVMLLVIWVSADFVNEVLLNDRYRFSRSDEILGWFSICFINIGSFVLGASQFASLKAQLYIARKQRAQLQGNRKFNHSSLDSFASHESNGDLSERTDISEQDSDAELRTPLPPARRAASLEEVREREGQTTHKYRPRRPSVAARMKFMRKYKESRNNTDISRESTLPRSDTGTALPVPTILTTKASVENVVAARRNESNDGRRDVADQKEALGDLETSPDMGESNGRRRQHDSANSLEMVAPNGTGRFVFPVED